MFPRMIPIEKTYDPDQIDRNLAAPCKLPRAIQLRLTAPVGKMGTARVDGIPLSRVETVLDAGTPKLLVPVGEVAREYDGTYTVELDGFEAKNGKKFPKCTFTLKTTGKKVQDPKYAHHDEQALVAAREGMVLLKNEGDVLPLAENATLNCFGRGQHDFRISATGASLINPRWSPNFFQAVEEHSGFTLNRELADFYRKTGAGTPDDAMLRRARELSDTALILLTRHSGENQDNRPIPGQYYLTEAEREMVATVAATFPKTLLILNTGYPIEMGWTKELGISAILYTGFAGMLATYALVEILDGRTNPSGKLPDTWTWDYYDAPASRNLPTLAQNDPPLDDDATGVRVYYEEDIYVGYRYFDTFGKDVAFPFGHGCSYTTFRKEAAAFHRTKKSITAEITVTNTGNRPGKEVVQLYLSQPEGKIEKCAHVLVGFEKTGLLNPGESQTLTISADNMDMASFEEASAAWVMERGTYRLFAGSLDDLLPCGEFTLEADTVVEQVSHHGCPVEAFPRLSKANPRVDGSRSMQVPLAERIPIPAERAAYAPEALPEYRGKTITWPELQKDPGLLDHFVAQMTTMELAKLNVCAGSQWGPGEPGTAGVNYAMGKYKLPGFSVSDANAGLNIRKPNVGFPASSVIAATFNKEIAYTVGKVIAQESRENGIFLNLGPGMNLHRNQLNGRHPEYYSEDPFLTGTMAGWQGKGLEENGCGCTYKHLFCNNSDLSRMGSHSVVSEQALRELYFRSFRKAFAIHMPTAVMTSYNALNGIYPAENADLLQGYLRTELGFNGFIMSDWDAYRTIDPVEMVKAGNCWITSGGSKWVKVIRKAAKDGKISRPVLEHNVRYLIAMLLKWNQN